MSIEKHNRLPSRFETVCPKCIMPDAITQERIKAKATLNTYLKHFKPVSF